MEARKWLKETLVLHALSRFEPLGRKTISRIIRIPEGSTRGMLNRLREAGYIYVTRSGVRVTVKGICELRSRMNAVRIDSLKQLPGKLLGVGPVSIAALIKGMAYKVGLGLRERDQAVGAGALGAVTVIYTDGVYSVPGVYRDLKAEAYEVYETLSRMFKPSDGDCVLIVFGEDYWIALEAVLTVALKAVEQLKS